MTKVLRQCNRLSHISLGDELKHRAQLQIQDQWKKKGQDSWNLQM